VQFGLDKKFHIAGAQQELEVRNGQPPEARIGTWATAQSGRLWLKLDRC
jgi:hypothetical protein